MNKGFHGFLQSLQENVGIVPILGQDPFFPNPFQFMNIHQSSHHPTLYCLDTEQVIKNPTKKTTTTLSAINCDKANIGSLLRLQQELCTNAMPFELDDCTVFRLFITSCFVQLRIHSTEHSSLTILFVNPVKQRPQISLNTASRSPSHILRLRSPVLVIKWVQLSSWHLD
jgi:hypothetical protein